MGWAKLCPCSAAGSTGIVPSLGTELQMEHNKCYPAKNNPSPPPQSSFIAGSPRFSSRLCGRAEGARAGLRVSSRGREFCPQSHSQSVFFVFISVLTLIFFTFSYVGEVSSFEWLWLRNIRFFTYETISLKYLRLRVGYIFLILPFSKTFFFFSFPLIPGLISFFWHRLNP